MPTLALQKNKIMQAATKAALATFAALLLSLFVITTTGCKKPTDNPPTGNNTTPTPCDTCLPPITTHGAGTFGCKINGKPFVARGNRTRTATQLDVDISKLYVSVIGRNYLDKVNIPSVSFSIEPLLDTGIINFPNNAINSWAQHRVGSQQFIAEDIIKGQIHFLRVDYQRRIFSGTFEFDVYDIYNIANGDTIHITEGRFDLHH
jgi:hypothetical protein